MTNAYYILIWYLVGMITVAQGDIKGKKLFLFICVSKNFWVTRGGGGNHFKSPVLYYFKLGCTKTPKG